MPNAQYARFFYLAKELGLDEDSYRPIIGQYTNSGSTSLKDLKRQQYFDLCSSLQNEVNKLKHSKPQQAQQPQPDTLPMRRKVCSLLHELGWEQPGGRIDWKRFNQFTRHSKSPVASRMLDAYDSKELQKLINCMEGMLKNNTLQQGREGVRELKQELNFPPYK